MRQNNAEVSDNFLQSSFVWRCLSFLHLGDASKYFDVTTEEVKERLKFTLYGHFIGARRPSQIVEQTEDGQAV